MRWLVIVLGSSACNWAFGIKDTRELDARPVEFFDAPIDAPFACPPIGMDPVFTNLLRPVIAQDCKDYSISTMSSTAIAFCNAPGRSLVVGPVDQMLATATGLATDNVHLYFEPAVLSPEGDEIFVSRTDTVGTTPELASFHLAGGVWSAGAPLPATFDQTGFISAPTRGPNRRIIHKHSGFGVAASLVRELADNGANIWTQVQAYTPTDLDATFTNTLRLSPDGLRLMFFGAPLATPTTRSLMYADRMSINDRFSKARPLTSVTADSLSTAYMNDDCSRIYMTTQQQIVYVQRQ